MMARFGLGKKALLTALGVTTGTGVALGIALENTVKADLILHPPHLKWPHSGLTDSFDHESIRRGYQVMATSLQ